MKDILLQLNNIKNIKADSEWKERSKEILLSQISGSSVSPKVEDESGFVYYFKNFIHQPVAVVAVILFVIFGGGVFGISASFDSKPGDSLYIAKIISEKAQLTFTFDEKEKVKLNIEFAKNRAKELAQIMNDNDENQKDATVEKLSNNFKKEINATKARLTKTNIQDDSVEVFSANVGRSDQGLEIYDASLETEVVADNSQNTSTSSEDNNIVVRKIGVNETLDQAEKLFSEHDYDGALNKLTEVEAIINGNNSIDKSGDVLGAKENNATTTEQ